MNEAYPVVVETATILPVTSPRLLDQVRGILRAKHYSYRTEQAYVHWIRRFVLFHGKRHPREMGTAEIERFLTDLAVAKTVAASTQTQALCAVRKSGFGVRDSSLQRNRSCRGKKCLMP